MAVAADLRSGANRSAVTAMVLVGQEVPVLIDQRVAVVVDVVAGLGDRYAAALRYYPCAVPVLAVLTAGTGMVARSAVVRVAEEVEVLVDEAVAVVIDVVAALTGRDAGSDRGDPRAVAPLTDLSPCTAVSACSAVGRVGKEVVVLVDPVVAVVVHVVAHLGGGRSTERLRDRVRAVPVLADLSGRAGVSTRSAVTVVDEEVEVLVDLIIAVVVPVVADFGGGHALIDRYVPGAVTVSTVLAAGADIATDAAVEVIVEEVEVLVDGVVAVVVAVVARLRGGNAGLDGGDPLAVAAGTHLVQPTAVAAGAAVVHIEEQVIGLVDAAVAVVVDVVAHLRSRAATHGDVPLAVAAFAVLVRSTVVAASATVERVDEQVEVLVDPVVAVVVDLVTHLRSGGAAVYGDVPGAVATHAGLSRGASVAASATVRIVREQVEVLVDAVVAVVVRLITHLRRGGAVDDRGIPGAVPVGAMLSSGAGVAAEAAVEVVHEKVEVLVDGVVTVIVRLITHLGGGDAVDDRGVPLAVTAFAVLPSGACVAASTAVENVV